MKILHIMAGRGQGGAETYSTDVMLSLHQAAKDLPQDSTLEQVVVMAASAPRFNELRDAGLTMAPKVLDSHFRFVQRWRMRALIKREKPDVIHCWMRRAASLIPACDVPVIGWFGGYYNPRHFKQCTQFVGVTRDITSHMVKEGVAQTRAHFIPTFPDIAALPAADRTSLATPKDAKVLLALSRLHPKKGLDTLLMALQQLPDCFVWLAGDGPLRRELEALAKKLGVIERVRFLGWRTDRAALLRATTICVLPSRYEPFGTVILEAWAAGTPLVACRSAGPAAHIDDGVNGLLAPIDDVAALTNCIRRVLDDENLSRRLIAQGYATYIKSYTREAVTQQWLEFYQTITGKKISLSSREEIGDGE
jgi:glycosyltransferase involved in cell wall biosynthesis